MATTTEKSKAGKRVTRQKRKKTPAPEKTLALLNDDVAQIFERIADLLEIEEENPFRVRAYRNAARVVRDLPKEVRAMVGEGYDLTELPGIGADLAGKIREIVTTGECTMLHELEQKTPPALATLLKIPALGPKRVRALYDGLGVQSVDELAEMAKSGEIHQLPGFGELTEQRILRSIEALRGHEGRYRLAVAEQYAGPLVSYLKAIPKVEEVILAGSYRRGKETVGDLDVLVTAAPGSEVMDRFVAYPEVVKVDAKGPTRATVILRSGLQVDLRLVPAESYGAALHYFTGSKAHNIAIRKLGQERGLKINEYGVFKGDERVAGDTEASVFACVDLPFIPPELREDRGEIEAARKGKLPTLLELGDLRGDLHAHTTASDGRSSLKEMADAARALGFEYLAITEHSRRVTIANGLDADRLLAHIDAIDRLNARMKGFLLLKGIEVDILEDGSLDMPDEVLARLDVVVCSVHSHFGLGREAQTKRILRAMDNRHFSILGHPTGRLIGSREPIELDLERIVRHAKKRGCFLELNAQPERLDLWDVYLQMARDEGVKIALSSDAHSIYELSNLRFGVIQARRGWLEKDDVINTRSLAELKTLLHRAR